MNRFLRALRADCSYCWGHRGTMFQGHWKRCGTCNGSGTAS